MALPPPPNPTDPQEVPTKQLGPILTRSMLDIRSDIAEVFFNLILKFIFFI